MMGVTGVCLHRTGGTPPPSPTTTAPGMWLYMTGCTAMFTRICTRYSKVLGNWWLVMYGKYQSLELLMEKKEEISRGGLGACPPPPHPPPPAHPAENVESRDQNMCNLRHSGHRFEEI